MSALQARLMEVICLASPDARLSLPLQITTATILPAVSVENELIRDITD